LWYDFVWLLAYDFEYYYRKVSVNISVLWYATVFCRGCGYGTVYSNWERYTANKYCCVIHEVGIIATRGQNIFPLKYGNM
jgi:hypothetical protein